MRVASIGECMVELTLPREGGDGSRVGFAGDTFNAAVYLKRSAPEITVSYVTALGTDPLSAQMIAFFEAESLDTSLIERRADRAPGLYAISLDANGERSFTYWRETSAARTLFLPPAKVKPSNLDGYDLIYLSGITLAVLAPEARAALADFLRGFRERGGRLAFDSNYRPRLWPNADSARREISAFWAITDIGLPSLDDEMALFDEPGEAAVLARLAAAGVQRGALKRGPGGPLPLAQATEFSDFPPAKRVVDTTAAGDSFNGAYLAALMRGEPEAACLAAGHAMASEVIGHPGAIIPNEAHPVR
jgi:2-dehydro-3-deoxygluconokinase